jgi:hypothetical protein
VLGNVDCRRLGLAIAATCALCVATAVPAGARGWTVQPTPFFPVPDGEVPASSQLSGVSCASLDTCTGVGWVLQNTLSPVPLAEYWDGTSWTTLPDMTDFEQPSPLLAVSCGAPSQCLGVGYDTTRNGPQLVLAQVMTPTFVGDVSPPLLENPPNFSEAPELSAVSCTAPALCTAVGSALGGDDPPLLVERWDGSTWERQFAAPPGADFARFSGVACPSATWCVAVGDAGDFGDSPLAETWDGSKWSLDQAPMPAGLETAGLGGVSCPSVERCVAIGGGTEPDGQHSESFAERLEQGVWTVENVASPADASSWNLGAISCPTSSICTAVGSQTDAAGAVHALAERRHDGRWHVQDTPTVPGAIGDVLSSVSCPSQKACTAVGDWSSPAGEYGSMPNTLAERWLAGHRHGRDLDRRGHDWHHGH